MAVDIGPKIGIEGESEFRKQLKNVNEQIKTLGSEMKVVEAAFEGQEKSEEALTAKSRVLTEEIGKQREKVDLLTKGLKESAEKYGENDERTLKWQQAVNNATAELNKMENQLDKTTAELKDEASGAAKAGDETEEAGKQAKESEGNWKGLGDTVAAVGAAMAAAAAAAAAAIVSAGKALADFAVSGAAYADDLLTMSTVTGMSTEKLQELQYAADLVDVSVDTITGSMKKNLASMSKAAKGNEATAAAYKKLGVAVTDANGNLRDDETVYWELINALGQVEDETQRDVLAMELLGKSASDLNPLIEAGADKMAELADDAHKAGYVLSDDTLGAFGEFDDQLRRLDKGAEAAKNAMGTILLPVLTDLAGEGVDLLGQFTNGILDANGDISKMGEVIDTVLPQVLDSIMAYLPELLDLAISIITAIADALLENVDVIIDAAADIVFSLFDGIMDNLPKILDAAVNLIITLAQGIIDNLPTIIEAGISLILAVVKGLADALPELIPATVDAVLTIVDTLIDNLDLLIEAAIQLIVALAGGLIDALPRLLEKAPEIVVSLAEAIIKAAPKLLDAALQLILKLAEGLASFFFKIKDKGREIVDEIKGGFQEKVDNASQWGKDLIQNFVDGLKARWENLKSSVSGIAQTVKDFLGFSEPKKGPLSNFSSYAPDMIDLFIQGLREGQRRLQAQLSETFDPASLTSAGVADVTVGSAGMMGVTIPLTVDGQLLTRVVAQIMFQQNQAVVRNYGRA